MKNLKQPSVNKVEWMVRPRSLADKSNGGAKNFKVVSAQLAHEAWKEARLMDKNGGLLPFAACECTVVEEKKENGKGKRVPRRARARR